MAIFGIIVALIISTKIGTKQSTAGIYSPEDFAGGYKLFAAGIISGACGLFSGYVLFIYYLLFYFSTFIC